MGPSGAASCSAKGSSGGIIDKRKREKDVYPPAGTSLQDSLTGLITPVGLYLSVFTCGEKAYIVKHKKRHG
jgi:hypothetical protein